MRIIRTISLLSLKTAGNIEKLQKRIEKLPKERLTYSTRRGRVYWYMYEPGKRRKTYISRKRRSYAGKLALRYVLEARLEDQQRLLDGCRAFLMKTVGNKDNAGDDAAGIGKSSDLGKPSNREKPSGNSLNGNEWISTEERLFLNRPVLKELLPDVIPVSAYAKTWLAEPFKSSDAHPENLRHRGPGGVMMRSKSEVMIASALRDAGIAYRYECPLTMNGFTVYPDFTILDEQNHCLVYWEHLGLLDSSQYVDIVVSKLSSMLRFGLKPGLDLILTSETAKQPFEMEDAVEAVRHYFGSKEA